MEKTVYYSGLAFFPTIVIKYLDKSNLRGKGFILHTIPEEYSPPWQEQVSHIASTLR